jgi:signal transduction histidine kinase/streptogramin lyase
MRSSTLLRRDPGTGSWRRYPLGGAGSIVRILPVRERGVWVGTSGGLIRLDPRTGRSTWFRHDPADPTSLGSGFVPVLLVDRAGRLWAGTGEGGLNEVGLDGRVLRRFVNAPSDPASLSDDYVTAIHEDRSGILWVGTRSGGVNALDRETGRIVRHQPDPGDPRALSHHNVTAIHEDAAGRLWIATGGGGLNLADRSGRLTRFTRYTAADGLVNNNVMAILEDDDGSLWLSTKRGLARFDPGTRAFTNYFVEDGLPSSEFEPGAAVRTERSLLFGSVAWVAAVRAGTRLPDAAPSPTVVTSVRGQSGDLRAAAPPWSLDRLELPWGTWFSIEVAVLDFNTQHNHAHAYRLGQNGGDFVELGANRTITFTDLAPGRYEFAARGRNCQGVWTQTSPALRIDIVPPFWMTRWFRILSIALVVGVVFVAHRVRLSSLEKRNRELVSLHDQRERATRELGLAYARLQVLARRLEAAKEEERKKIARELHDDLGPALTAVVINLQLLGQERDKAKVARRVGDSIDLVDRMVQQIRDLSLNLRPPLMDEMGLVGALKGYLETQAERTGLEIVVDGDASVEGLSPETEITAFRVTQEAVTNAIRHAAPRRIAVRVRAEFGGLEITVSDDGRGFDARAALEGPATGKSLGLLGMQERAKMLGGRIRIDSSPGAGTRVLVHIPLRVVA